MAVKLFYRNGRAIVVWGERKDGEVTKLDPAARNLHPSINAAKRRTRELLKTGAKFERPE